jgi:hypothetical protein
MLCHVVLSCRAVQCCDDSCCAVTSAAGFCQVVLERSQFLDANVESAKMMTVLASLLAESGAHKRADTLLRQALELFWRELKDPTPAVARCYRVRLR